MTSLQTISRVTAGLLAAAAFAIPAVAADHEAAMREMQDRAQIEKLMWQYARALDTLNPEAYAAVYTADGQFGTGEKAIKGREALKKMIVGLRDRAAENEAKTGQKRAPMYHVETNPMLEFTDKDHALLHGYWMTVFGAAGEQTPPRVAAAGAELNQLVRVNGQWLIKVRDVASKEGPKEAAKD